MASALLSSRVVTHGGNCCFSYQNICFRQRHFRLVAICSSSSHSSPSTRPIPPPLGRRSASLAAVLLCCLSDYPKRAEAGSPFDKYVKRKKLEPLEAYVPAVLLTEEQFKDLGCITEDTSIDIKTLVYFPLHAYNKKLVTYCFQDFITLYYAQMYLIVASFDTEDSLNVEQPEYDLSRSLLRSGPAASFRINIRAVAQYADDDGKGKAASDAVERCLRALEDLDSLLLHASRNDPTASIKSMKNNIKVALESLDSLLQTVPASVLDKGKAIADAYRIPYLPAEENTEETDSDLKKLKAIL